MSYEPNPGSIAARAIAHLEGLNGAEVAGPALAEAIGVQPSSLAACLEAPKNAGVIFCRKKGGHIRSPVFWSTKDHSEAPRMDWRAAQQDIQGGSPRQVLKAEAERPDATDRGADADSPGGGPMGAGQAAAAAPLQGTRVALSSDGDVAVEATDGTVILFRGDLAKTVRAFLRGAL